jgi:hypothetical protein
VVDREGVSEGATEMKEGADADDVLQPETNADSKGEGEAMMEGVSETKDSEAGSAGMRAASPCCYRAAILAAAGYSGSREVPCAVDTFLNIRHATLIKCA